MCVAYPAQVIAVEDQIAMVQAEGRLQRVILLALECNLPAPGDWLLVQSGLALAALDKDEAAQRIRLQHMAQGGLS